MARERTLTALRRRAPEARPLLLPTMSHEVRQQMRAEGQRGEELTRDMVYIPIREITYTPEHLNSRVQYDRDSLADLAESIREHGIIQPIVVRPLPAAEATEWTLTIGDEPIATEGHERPRGNIGRYGCKPWSGLPEVWRPLPERRATWGGRRPMG